MNPISSPHPVALVTGAARRIGSEIAEALHQAGYNLILHYRNSNLEAESLCNKLNRQRADSTTTLQAELLNDQQIQQLAKSTVEQFGRLDVLVNNASSFYPTPIENVSIDQWDDLIGSNLKAPYFLSAALASELVKTKGTIINIADIHGEKPLSNHSIYCIAKAGNRMMTKSLAKELAPDVRVNGIAPGAIMWPEDAAELGEPEKEQILKKIPLNRPGNPKDIASAVLFLATSASYITGEIITIDGGRNAAL